MCKYIMHIHMEGKYIVNGYDYEQYLGYIPGIHSCLNYACGSLASLVVTKLHVCYLLGGAR